MSLIKHNLSKTLQTVADKVYEKHFEVDSRLEEEYSEYRKEKMYEDILHNLSFLEVSLRLEEKKIFDEYALWLYQLMLNRINDLTAERIKEQLITHYEILNEMLSKYLEEPVYEIANQYLLSAIERTKKATVANLPKDKYQDKYGIFRKTYLEYLINENSETAINYIKEISKTQLTLDEIYVDILQEVMIEIGEMWYRKEISVDQEHYMTSLTQVVMAEFYEQIFSGDKNGLTLLACSIGSELHEMGARMISDLFEHHGWDSIYLGAAISEEVLLEQIKTLEPNLLALSVTMPQHLTECKSLIEVIRNRFPSLRIAVGGRAFSMTDEIWKKWPVDVHRGNAKELISWADQNFGENR